MKYFEKEITLAGCSYKVIYADGQFNFKGCDGMNTNYFTLEICKIGLLDLVESRMPCSAKHISEAVRWMENNIEKNYSEGVITNINLI